jgi:hypothetical protein
VICDFRHGTRADIFVCFPAKAFQDGFGKTVIARIGSAFVKMATEYLAKIETLRPKDLHHKPHLSCY